MNYTTDDLQPWARWMFKHKMKYLVILFCYLLLPVYILFGYLDRLTPELSVEQWSRDIESLKELK